jgi:MOSC domain-containing protein YiiM
MRPAAARLHLRVLTPGELVAGDAIEVLERPAHEITVADAVSARFDPMPDRALVARVLALPELAEKWRAKTAPRYGSRSSPESIAVNAPVA